LAKQCDYAGRPIWLNNPVFFSMDPLGAKRALSLRLQQTV